MADGDLSRTFENTFEPNCMNKHLTLRQIISALRMSVLDYDKLPAEIKTAVMTELRSRRQKLVA